MLVCSPITRQNVCNGIRLRNNSYATGPAGQNLGEFPDKGLWRPGCALVISWDGRESKDDNTKSLRRLG